MLLVSSGDWSMAIRKLKWATVSWQKPVCSSKSGRSSRRSCRIGFDKRMQRAGLQPEPAAVALLAELVEGNLLAAQQEIDKLLLLNQARAGDGGRRRPVRARAARASIRFAWWSARCRAPSDECLRVAAGLQRTGVAIQAVTGAMYRELTVADTARAAIAAGESEAAVFGRLRVWPARQGPMRQALRRLSAFHFGEVFRALGLDRPAEQGARGGRCLAGAGPPALVPVRSGSGRSALTPW